VKERVLTPSLTSSEQAARWARRACVAACTVGALSAPGRAWAQAAPTAPAAAPPAALAQTPPVREVAGVAMPAAWPPGEEADTHWGVRVPDPYRALENVADERVQRWMRAHADATSQVLSRIPGRAELLARIQAIDAQAGGVVGTVLRQPGGRLFYTRREPGEQQLKLVFRATPEAAERVLVDPDALSRTAGRPVALQGFSPSPDGRLLAYGLQAGGAEIGELHVVEAATGRPVMPPIDRIRGASVSWLEDGSGFFYSRLREGYDRGPRGERFNDTSRHFRTLDGSDRIVFSASREPALALPVFATGWVFEIPGTRQAGMWVSLGVERNGLFFVADLEDAKAGRAKWRKVFGTEDEVRSLVGAADALYLLSAKGAPRFQVLRLSAREPDLARAEVVVAQGEGAIAEIAAAADALYFTRRDGVNTRLYRVPHAGAAATPRAAIEEAALPMAGSVDILGTDRRVQGVVLRQGSWTRVSRTMSWEPGRGAQTLQLAREGAFDAPAGLTVREVMVTSHDGVRVPLTVIAREGLKLDGRNPTILYGYGAYGTVEAPSFGPRLLAWLERGGVYAIAHVRGGGIFGREWHEAGRKTTKPNTWKDAIAASEWLVREGYASPGTLGLSGGSAGGILVGRALTERPDLYAAALPSVPVLDTVRSEVRANGVANIPEYGTVRKEDEFRGLLAMSSYQAVREGTRYPGVLLLHGVNDARVDVWQSSKFYARLSAAQAGNRPVLMRLDYEAGHGSGSSREQAQQRQADAWAFLLWQFGVPGFQPPAPVR
jgi:prolyl oligopeptidase